MIMNKYIRLGVQFIITLIIAWLILYVVKEEYFLIIGAIMMILAILPIIVFFVLARGVLFKMLGASHGLFASFAGVLVAFLIHASAMGII